MTLGCIPGYSNVSMIRGDCLPKPYAVLSPCGHKIEQGSIENVQKQKTCPECYTPVIEPPYLDTHFNDLITNLSKMQRKKSWQDFSIVPYEQDPIITNYPGPSQTFISFDPSSKYFHCKDQYLPRGTETFGWQDATGNPESLIKEITATKIPGEQWNIVIYYNPLKQKQWFEYLSRSGLWDPYFGGTFDPPHPSKKIEEVLYKILVNNHTFAADDENIKRIGRELGCLPMNTSLPKSVPAVPPSQYRDRTIENIENAITCPISLDIFRHALHLHPCGHKIDQESFNHLPDKTICPLCRTENVVPLEDRELTQLSSTLGYLQKLQTWDFFKKKASALDPLLDEYPGPKQSFLFLSTLHPESLERKKNEYSWIAPQARENLIQKITVRKTKDHKIAIDIICNSPHQKKWETYLNTHQISYKLSSGKSVYTFSSLESLKKLHTALIGCNVFPNQQAKDLLQYLIQTGSWDKGFFTWQRFASLAREETI